MMNGLVVKKGALYIARIGPKSIFYDEHGQIWTKELQAARVFPYYARAVREAKRVGGDVRVMKNGRLEE